MLPLSLLAGRDGRQSFSVSFHSIFNPLAQWLEVFLGACVFPRSLNYAAVCLCNPRMRPHKVSGFFIQTRAALLLHRSAGSKCFLLHCERARAVHLCLLQAAKLLSRRRLRAARLQVFSDARSQTQSNRLQLLRICCTLDGVSTMADNPNVALDVTCNKDQQRSHSNNKTNAGTNPSCCRCGRWRGNWGGAPRLRDPPASTRWAREAGGSASGCRAAALPKLHAV